MKRFIVLLMSLFLLTFSCKKAPAPEKKNVNYIWTGQSDKWDIRHMPPVCIIWYKYVQPPGVGWRPYKSFNQNDANDMRDIILQLFQPEIEIPNPNFKTTDKLSLIFYNGFPEELMVREVYFEFNDIWFIGPTGKSNKLGQILLERQEVNKYFFFPSSNHRNRSADKDFYRMIDMNEVGLEMEKIEEKAKRELLILYQKNGDPNELSRIEGEWRVNIESLFAKYSWADINEIRGFEEDWWKLLEEKAIKETIKTNPTIDPNENRRKIKSG